MKEPFQDDTFDLMWALHHINIAKQHLEQLTITSSGAVKNVFNNYIQKCDWIAKDVLVRLEPESREDLKSELKDSLVFPHFQQLLLDLTTEQRSQLESIAEAMKKGEEVIMEKA